MIIQILTRSDRSLRATCGKKTALIYRATTGDVWVVCENVMHKAHTGGGRSFPSFEAAVDGYKSAEMKAILEVAQEKLSASR